MADITSAEGILEIVSTAKNLIDRTKDNSSLVQKTKLVRVEPTVLVDSNLRASECTTDLLHTLLGMFAGFYVQAVSIGLDGMAVKAARKLEPYGTNPIDYKGAGMDQLTKYATESYNNFNPGYKSNHLLQVNPFTKEKIPFKEPSLEDDNDYKDKTGIINVKVGQDKIDNMVKEIQNNGNFSIGKIVNIQVKEDHGLSKDNRQVVSEINIPVGIRLFTSFVNSDNLTDILAQGTAKLSAVERKVEYKMGNLKFIRDVILCRDMYKQFRRNLMVDKTGYVKSNLDRRSSGLLYNLIKGQRPAAISALMVLTKSSTRSLEEKTLFKLDNHRERNKLFTQTGTMIMAVVDDDYRMVKFYFHSIERSMDVSFSELKKVTKDSSLNVNDVVSALSMGNAPRL